MDLQLFGRVLWRFRALVGVGLAVAFLLAILSYTKLGVDDNGLPTLTYREPEQYVSYSTIFVTQKGFPWGKLSAGGEAGVDPARLTSLAVIYSQLALSDQVRKIMLRKGPIEGTIETAAVTASRDDALPLVRIAAIAPSATKAQTLAARETEALRTYISNQQRANAIRPQNRVVLEVVSRPSQPTLYEARGKTRPIVVFLAVAIAFCALAFVLENLRLDPPGVLGRPGTGAPPPPASASGAVAEPMRTSRAASRVAGDESKPARESLHIKPEIAKGGVGAGGGPRAGM